VEPADLAVIVWSSFAVLGIGLRAAIQWRRTGTTGLRGLSGEPGSLEWLGGVLFVLGLVFGIAGPVAQQEGTADPIAALDGRAGHVAGAVLAVGGLAATLYAQLAMGREWRIGVDPTERTGLVTGGPFALVRNPIYTAMLTSAVGIALLVPNPVTLAGLATLVAAFEMQTRFVEEPHLRRLHGDAYLAYASRVGRFVPGLGRLS
jgi:protein-S-isoprenylcysteine O-methyltransferase Ste14